MTNTMTLTTKRIIMSQIMSDLTVETLTTIKTIDDSYTRPLIEELKSLGAEDGMIRRAEDNIVKARRLVNRQTS